ncbi:probable cytochrome P450 313a4 [Bactrocera neohumeralis]|uniref:probable cytochrome P450 313a4 n=1 Tax=Bactrocera neohumeralis TaxID=98809 RepID=UPI0021663DAA|nr:probable cytochrome P450 313a4 [Bactrocera neohumeralis]
MELADKRDFIKLIILSLMLALWFYWLWMRKNLYLFALRFPGLFGWPIFGILLRIKSQHNLIQEFGKIFKDCKAYTVCTWIGMYPVIITADPPFIKDVLSAKDLLNKAQPLYQPLYDAFKGGLIASPADQWHKNRRMINPSFHQKVLTSFLPVFNKAKDGAVLKFRNFTRNEHVFISEVLQRITLSITVETTMGNEMQKGDQVSEELVKSYIISMEKLPIECFLAYVKLDRLYAWFTKASKEFVYKFIKGLLYGKLSQTPSTENIRLDVNISSNNTVNSYSHGNKTFNEKKPNIFIDRAINLYREGKFSHQDLIGETNTIVSAAFETTANGLLSALLMLAMHPAVQERLFEEIENMFPDKHFFVDCENITNLPYLDMVVNETLRLMPSIPMIGRQVIQDTTLSNGLVIPKGIEILVSIFDLHRRTDIWGANADKFNPENFLRENLQEKHSHAYIPFSKGVRDCIGWKYALMAIKVLLAGFIRNFSFETNVKLENLKFTNNVSLKYTNEPAFTIKDRCK